MNMLWKKINAINVKKEIKNRLFLIIMVIVNCVLGGVLWLVLGRLILPGMEWLFCFIGYPAVVIGLFGGVIYLYNHEFM